MRTSLRSGITRLLGVSAVAIGALWSANAPAAMYLDARLDTTANAGTTFEAGGADTKASTNAYSVTLGPDAPAQGAGVVAGSDIAYVDLWAIIDNPNGLLSNSSATGSRVGTVRMTAAVMGGTGLAADLAPVFDNDNSNSGGLYDQTQSQAGYQVLAGNGNTAGYANTGDTAGWGVPGFYTLGGGSLDGNLNQGPNLTPDPVPPVQML